jgi:hypothetical protein
MRKIVGISLFTVLVATSSYAQQFKEENFTRVQNSNTQQEKERCLVAVRNCQEMCGKLYTGEKWTGCRLNCGNAGSCN